MPIQTDIPSTHTDLLGPNTAFLTTVGDGGLPQSTAVWFLVDDDGTVKTSILTSRQKYKNLARHPKATLFILDPANPYRTLEVRADVELTADPDKALLPKFAERYNVPVEVLEQAGDDRVVATLTPVRVVANG
jgi:PPOX class probable F420-dependent enzyme